MGNKKKRTGNWVRGVMKKGTHFVLVNYRRAKQHLIPVRPRNQQHPMKRINATAALDHKSAWKKWAVRLVAVFYDYISRWSSQKGRERVETHCEAELIDGLASDADCHGGITEDPKGDKSGTETLVRVLEGLFVVFHGGNVWGERTLHSCLELAVDIRLGLVDFFYYCVLATLVLGSRG